MSINVAIIGVGNCASSLVQGLEFYRHIEEGDEVPGIMHPVVGGYHINDINWRWRSTSTPTRWARTSRKRSSPARTTRSSSPMCLTQA